MSKYVIVLLLAALLAVSLAIPQINHESRFVRSARAEPSPHRHGDCDGPPGGFGGFGPSAGAGAEAEASAGSSGFGGMTPFGGSGAGAGAQASANSGSQAFGK